MKHLLTQPHIILTTENPHYSVKHPMSVGTAINILSQHGPGNVMPVKGRYNKKNENSIFISNPTKKQTDLARAMLVHQGQQSILESNGYDHNLRYHPNDGGILTHNTGTEILSEDHPEDFTQLPDGTRFRHNLTFKPEDPDPSIEKKEDLNKAPLIGDYDDSIAHDHKKTVANIKQLQQRDGAIETNRDGIKIFSVGNPDFHDKGKNPFGWHYLTHNDAADGTPIAYTKIARGDDADIRNGIKGPYSPQAYVAPNHRGKDIHKKLIAHAADYHGGVHSDQSLSPAANRSYQKLANEGRAKLSPTQATSDLRNDEYVNNLDTDSADYDAAAYSQHFVKSELQKGSLQQRFPFSPLEHAKNPQNLDNIDRIYAWQGYGNPRSSRIHRDHIKTMEGNEKIRALHKLSGSTKVRRAQDGGREFLLHRGVREPHAEILPDGFNNDTHIQNRTRSSWTPNYHIAAGFSGNRKPDSAWIHENKIASVPNQLGNPEAYLPPAVTPKEKVFDQFPNKFKQGKNPLDNEHEVVVEPHVSERANFDTSEIEEKPIQDINERISARAKPLPKRLKGLSAPYDPQSPKSILEHRRGMGKSELEKAQPVDFKKYGFSHSLDKYGMHHVHVHEKNNMGGGALVGEFQFTDDHPSAPNKLFPLHAFVHPDHQRKGLATEAYKMAQEKSGLKLVPSISQTPDAKKLWSQPNRPFGKSQELQKSPMILDTGGSDWAIHRLQDADRAVDYGQVLSTNQVGDNLFHHHIREDNNRHYHILTENKDPALGGAIAMASGYPQKNKHLQIDNAAVDPLLQGKGYGKKLYGIAAKIHGGIMSDHNISEDAHRLYQSFSKNPDFKTKLGPTQYELAGNKSPYGYEKEALKHPHTVELNNKSESIIGGKGDKSKNSDFDPKQFKMGHKVEMEHTNNPKIAAEITRDHLKENPRYYSKLKQIGLADELKKIDKLNQYGFSTNQSRLNRYKYEKGVNMPYTMGTGGEGISGQGYTVRGGLATYGNDQKFRQPNGGPSYDREKAKQKAKDVIREQKMMPTPNLGKSKLNKMSRPVLKFPNLGLKAMPNQDVRSIANSRQKEIAARAQINEMVPKGYHKVHRQKSVDDLESKIMGNRGGFSTMRTSDEDKNLNQKGLAWAKQGNYTIRRGKGVPYNQLTPKGKVYQDSLTDQAMTHEAHHKLYHDLRRKIGQTQTNDLLASYTQLLHPEVKSKIVNHLSRKGYGADSTDNEEIINHVRDIVSSPPEREMFYETSGTKTPTDQMKVTNHLKQVWNQIYNKAKSFKPS